MNMLSIIIPAKNEADNLDRLLPQIIQLQTDKKLQFDITVINDGSSDQTLHICKKHDVKVINHPYSRGNGAAIKSGARAAKNDILLFMDADGQHAPHYIPKLLAKLNEGHDMVVGARSASGQANQLRRIGNHIYNKLASFMTGYKIDDLTSGYRIVKRDKFLRFLYLLPNGFSYPTTSTMAFFRSGYSVSYLPIESVKREGKSHIHLLKDGIRFFTIILKIGALFSPMRLFLPISALLLITGLGYYSYTYIEYGRFTNMSALLLVSSLNIFMLGILSEQISSLHYKSIDEHGENT